MSNTKSRGDLYWADFTGRGSEQQGWRPALIVQNDISNASQSYTMTIVIPLSSRVKRYPSNIRIDPDGGNGLTLPSDVIVGQITSITKQAIGKRIGTLSTTDMARVDGILSFVLGLHS